MLEAVERVAGGLVLLDEVVFDARGGGGLEDGGDVDDAAADRLEGFARDLPVVLGGELDEVLEEHERDAALVFLQDFDGRDAADLRPHNGEFEADEALVDTGHEDVEETILRAGDVACLAGGGPTQLFDFVAEARIGRLSSEGPTPVAQMQALRQRWSDIRMHAADPNRMWLGHPYTYWSSLMAGAMFGELERARSRVFVAQGSLDGIHAQYAVDLVESTLMAEGRDVTALLVDGANHGFQFKDQSKKGRDGWREILQTVVGWFFAPPMHQVP